MQVHTKVFRCIKVYERKYLKSILTNLYCTKYNEIDIRHSDVKKKHLSYTGSHEKWTLLGKGWKCNFQLRFYYTKF